MNAESIEAARQYGIDIPSYVEKWLLENHDLDLDTLIRKAGELRLNLPTLKNLSMSLINGDDEKYPALWIETIVVNESVAESLLSRVKDVMHGYKTILHVNMQDDEGAANVSRAINHASSNFMESAVEMLLAAVEVEKMIPDYLLDREVDPVREINRYLRSSNLRLIRLNPGG